jgi:hypothetical protein
MSEPKLIYIYFHVCAIHNYEVIFLKMMNTIKQSGLYDIVQEIRCCVLGENVNWKIFDDPKIAIHATHPDPQLYEVFTINHLLEDAKKEDAKTNEFYVLYLHTKGVTRSNTRQKENIIDWVNYMLYFTVEKYNDALELLAEGNDTVGVNLEESPELHYSGNFWWSKSSYIARLPTCKMERYNSPEFWLTEKRIGIHHCSYKSQVNHYFQRFPRECYIQ